MSVLARLAPAYLWLLLVWAAPLEATRLRRTGSNVLLSARVNRSATQLKLQGQQQQQPGGSAGLDAKAEVNIVPQPRKVELLGEAPLQLGSGAKVAIVAPQALRDLLQQHILSPTNTSAAEPAAASATIELRLQSLKSQGGDMGTERESYHLEILPRAATISAATEHGLFNGIMTLRQLLNRRGGAWSLPAVVIEDAPAFEWRGLMLDVSRHFFPAEAVKHLLSTMALFKLNRFHWHLTDDQGWRLPVDKYPKLTSVGGWRTGTQLGHNQGTSDGVRYGGSYTKEEVQDVVRFAHSLHIQVVPEFDLPGHLQSALAAYPQLSNLDVLGTGPEVATTFGALQYTLSPTDRSFNFVEDVLGAVEEMFPDQYVHIGGDEVNSQQWEQSSQARSFLEKKQLSSFREVEGIFTERAANFLAKHHRRAVVWDEAMFTGRSLPPGTVVMIWRSWENTANLLQKAESMGLHAVLTPHDPTYFDQWQSPMGIGEPYDAIGGKATLQDVYQLQLGGAKVLGGQGQLWSEYIAGGQPNMDYMAWPRGCALAEAVWSGDQRPGYEDFLRRLQPRLEELKSLGVKFRAPH